MYKFEQDRRDPSLFSRSELHDLALHLIANPLQGGGVGHGCPVRLYAVGQRDGGQHERVEPRLVICGRGRLTSTAPQDRKFQLGQRRTLLVHL